MDYNKTLRLIRNLLQLVIRHDTHPKDANNNGEHPNNVDTIDTNKSSDIINNDTLRNDVNNSNTNSNNININNSDNDDVNNIDK